MSDLNDQLEDKGAVFGRFSDEEYDGIKEGNGKIPWWLVMIVGITVFEAFLWTFPWPGYGQRYERVVDTFVSNTGSQPWWDWGYMLILFQIIVVLGGIVAAVWTINFKTKPRRKNGE